MGWRKRTAVSGAGSTSQMGTSVLMPSSSAAESYPNDELRLKLLARAYCEQLAVSIGDEPYGLGWHWVIFDKAGNRIKTQALRSCSRLPWRGENMKTEELSIWKIRFLKKMKLKRFEMHKLSAEILIWLYLTFFIRHFRRAESFLQRQWGHYCSPEISWKLAMGRLQTPSLPWWHN